MWDPCPSSDKKKILPSHQSPSSFSLLLEVRTVLIPTFSPLAGIIVTESVCAVV